MNGQVVIGRTKAVFRNMHVPHPKLPLKKDTKTIHEVDLSIPDRLYLRSCQYHARIVFVFDEIIMIRRSVLYFAHGAFYPLNKVSSVAIRSFKSFLLTIKSKKPCSSRNSLRWKPSGRSFLMVSLMTRGPAKPIRAPGSAILRSPSMPNEAEMPPNEGSVRRDIKGILASVRSDSFPDTLAICISE